MKEAKSHPKQMSARPDQERSSTQGAATELRRIGRQPKVKSSWRLIAIHVGALTLISCNGQTASPPTPSPTIDQAKVAQLEAKPMSLPVVPPGGPCPATPMKIIDYGTGSTGVFGNGPIYGIGGAQTTNTWGDYYDVSYVADPQFSGLVLIRIHDLKSSRVGVFVGPYAAGSVVGTDTIEGNVVQQHAELVLDASHPQTRSGNNKWGIWHIRQGLATGWSHCFGIQVDGAGFTEVFTGNG
jgi:hypothetical protein